MKKQTIVCKVAYDEYCGEITDFIDKYITGYHKNIHNNMKHVFRTYLYPANRYGNELLISFRYPGATRGHIELDKNNIIKDIKFYSDTCFGEGNLDQLYDRKIEEDIKQFIGQELVIEECMIKC